MKIGIDISTITPTKAGVGYFTYELTKALVTSGLDNTFVLYTNNFSNVEDFSIYENVEIKEIKRERADFRWIMQVSRDANKRVDKFISPANLSFSVLAKNTIQIVHDLAPIKYPKYFSNKGVFSYSVQMFLAMKRATNIVVPLEAIKQELIEHYPKTMGKVYVIGEGANDWTKKMIDPNEIEQIKRKYSLPDKFLLTTGTLEPRKNHVNMIKAFKSFIRTNPDYSYVVVGKKGWFYDEIFKTVEKLKLQDKVIFLGYVEEKDLLGIYLSAKVFLFCSFYEGFGLPLVEAASLNLPIVCSGIPSFKEIFKDQVEYSDPSDTMDIVRALRKTIDAPMPNYTELLNRFTWENTASNILNVIN